MKVIGKQILLLGVALAAGFGSSNAPAAPLKDDGSVARCIQTSSRGRPWLEKTLWGLYDQEAGWIGAEIQNRNGSVDLGPLQVNSQWVPIFADRMHRDREDIRRWLRDDACFNVGVAAWLFLAGYRATQDYWKAVGTYHSGHHDRARRYAVQVADRLKRRFGSSIFVK